MATKVRCNQCKGNKKVPGLGFIEETCTKCEGTGYEYLVAQKTIDDYLAKTEAKANGEAINEINETEEEVSEDKREKKQKRGRPKRT